MITVNFYGDLAQFGTRYKMHATSPAEAMRALIMQIKGLREHLENGSYQVRFKGKDYAADDLEQGFQAADSGVLHIVPRVAGAGKFGQIIVGIILVAAVFITGGMALPAAGSLGAGIMAFGVSLILGGIAQLLVKQPKMDLGKGAESKNSTSFSNLGNTQAQGTPVPLVYGKVLCGTRIISQSVESYRMDKKATPTDPHANTVFDTQIVKDFHEPVAALDPTGVPYNIDTNDDSVRAANYTAKLVKG